MYVCIYIYIRMCVCVCVCVYDELKYLLDEKGMQYKYNYLDMTETPHKTMTYLRMYCNSFPIVPNVNHSFSNFEESLAHFNHK